MKQIKLFTIAVSLNLLLGFVISSASEPRVQEDAQQDHPRRLILSIDGGGIRGILPATLLNWLEEQIEADLRQRHPHAPAPDIRLGDCFDLMAGTSTGGIISLALRVPDPQTHRPKYKTSVPLTLYQEKGAEIFPVKKGLEGWFGAKFDPANLERILHTYFGSDGLQDLLKPTLITAYNIHQEDLFLFKSHEAKTFKSKRFKLKDVARATSAAPTYLPAITIMAEAEGNEKPPTYTLVDGGVSANNPTLEAYIEAQQLYPNQSFHVISLGCGSTNIFTLESKEKGGKLQWATDISSVLMNTAATMAHTQVAHLAQVRGDAYTRIQFNLDHHVAHLDDATPKNINNLKGYAQREISNPQSEIHKIKQVLIDYYRARDFYVYYDLIQEVKQQLLASKTLNLSGRYVNERSLWEIGHFISKNNLQVESLNLSHNPLSPQVLKWIGTFRDLNTLDLTHTNLTEAGLKHLKETQVPTQNITLLARENDDLLKLNPHTVVFYLNAYQRLELDAPLKLKIGQYYEYQGDAVKAESFYQDPTPQNQMALAKLYFLGKGSAENPLHKGFTICKQLANQGYAEAQYTLGHLFAKPETDIVTYLKQNNEITAVEEQDFILNKAYLKKAAHWYRLAADQKHKEAAKALATLYHEEKIMAPIPQGGARDERYQLEEALKYYMIAKQGGSTSVDKYITQIKEQLKQLRG